MSLKDSIRDQIIEIETDELKGLQQMYKLHAQSADLDEETTLNTDDFSQQDQSRESARSLELRIIRAKTLLDNFLNLPYDKKEMVEEGSLVLTDSLNFYIGISTPQFDFEGTTFIGINSDAPIYQIFEGKKTGDKVDFNGKIYRILEIL